MNQISSGRQNWCWLTMAAVVCVAAAAWGQMTGRMPLPRQGTDLDAVPATQPAAAVLEAPAPVLRPVPVPDHAMAAPPTVPIIPGSSLPSPTPVPEKASTLAVHEWAVWVRGTAVGGGAPGGALGPAPEMKGQLPQWVIKRNAIQPRPILVPNGAQNWDKPVIHFYRGEGLDVTVTVKTPKGMPTAYWPPAGVGRLIPPGAMPPGMGGGAAPGLAAPPAVAPGAAAIVRPKPVPVAMNSMMWTGKLSADAPAAEDDPAKPAAKAPAFNPQSLRFVPADHWWSAIRKVPSLYLTTAGGAERFIFYEATAAQEPVVKSTVTGQTLTIENTFATAAAGQILVILNDGKSLHWAGVKDLAAGALVKLTRGEVEKGESNAGKLLDAARAQWESFGLTKEEAAAVVEVWKKDLTGHLGLMVVGKMPRDVYDQMFPLEVVPKPAEVVRVGVVFDSLPGQADRTQWFPDLDAQFKQWAKELDDDKYEVREAAGKKFAQAGELAVPLLKELARTGSAEVRNAAERLLKEIEQNEQPAAGVSPPVMRPPIRVMPLPMPVE